MFFSSGIKPESTSKPIWMKKLCPNSAQRCVSSVHHHCKDLFRAGLFSVVPSCPFQASLKKFLEYIQTGSIEKIAKVLEKGLDPNFHDPDSGGEFLPSRGLIISGRWTLISRPWVSRDSAVGGGAVRPADGGHQSAGAGRSSPGLQEQRRPHRAAQGRLGSQPRWAAGEEQPTGQIHPVGVERRITRWILLCWAALNLLLLLFPRFSCRSELPRTTRTAVA